MEDRSLGAGRAVLEMLQALIRDRLAREDGAHLIERRLPAVALDIAVALDGPDADPDAFSRRLVDSIDQQLDEAVQHVAAFRPGHAFCLRCGGPTCDHARPPSSRHVLAGYGPTGAPLWSDLAQVLLDRRLPGVDGLFDDPPELVTLVQQPDDVYAGVLRAFEHPSYLLLGQLIAGYFPVRSTDREGRGVVALTIQVAGTRMRGGGVRLGLNVVGLSPSGESLGTLWERHRDLPWRRGVRWAQAALATVPSTGRRADETVVRRRVGGILAGLARRMERERRARGRRTRHAEERHDSGRRPTPKALEDVRAALPEDVLIDERANTVVVLGRRGRTHFFNREGALVSSVRYSRDAIQRKLKAGVWRAAGPDDVAALRERAADAHVSRRDRPDEDR